jgi:hypothetical protein
MVIIYGKINPVISSHAISLRSILILFSNLRPGLPSNSFPSIFVRKLCTHALRSYAFYRFHPYSHLWFDDSNNQWGVQIVKLPIMKFSPATCYFLPLRSKYFSQALLSDTLSLFSSLSMRKQESYPHMKHEKWYSSVYFYLYVFTVQTERENIRRRMEGSVLRFQHFPISSSPRTRFPPLHSVDRNWGPPSILSKGNRGWSDGCVKLTSHLHRTRWR